MALSLGQIIRQVYNSTALALRVVNPDGSSISVNKATVATNTRPTVSNVSSVILASNSNRKSALIFNQSGAVVYLQFGAAAVVGQGRRLANNETYEIDSTNLYTGDIRAIRNAGSGEIEVTEKT